MNTFVTFGFRLKTLATRKVRLSRPAFALLLMLIAGMVWSAGNQSGFDAVNVAWAAPLAVLALPFGFAVNWTICDQDDPEFYCLRLHQKIKLVCGRLRTYNVWLLLLHVACIVVGTLSGLDIIL